MPILTYINDIPLFTTKTEALNYGARTSPKRYGYHTHVYEGITGYMAGYFHPYSDSKREVEKQSRTIPPPSYESYLSDVLEAVNSVQQEITLLENEKTNSEYVVDIENEEERERFNKLNKDKIETINQSLEYLLSEKDRIKGVEHLIQQSSRLEFEELLSENKIDLNIKDKAETTVQVVNQIVSTGQPIQQESETTTEETVEAAVEQQVESIGEATEELRKELFEKEVEKVTKEVVEVKKVSEEELKAEQLRRLEEEARRRSSGGY